MRKFGLALHPKKTRLISFGRHAAKDRMCGRLPVGKGFLGGDAELVGAAMCPVCLCGADLWPLAIMLSADQVPVKNTQSNTNGVNF